MPGARKAGKGGTERLNPEKQEPWQTRRGVEYVACRRRVTLTYSARLRNRHKYPCGWAEPQAGNIGLDKYKIRAGPG